MKLFHFSGVSSSGKMAATGQAAVNSDARLDLDETVRDQSALRSALAVPVISKGRSAGVLSFYACEPNAFDDTHRRLIAAASLVLAPSLTEIADRGLRSVPSEAQNSTHVLRN